MKLAINLEDYKDFKFPTLYQEQIFLTKYSRWIPEKNRRETWSETVYRYISYMCKQSKKFKVTLDSDLVKELYEAILNLEVMPSMRCMMTAGKALDKDSSAGYNCAYLHINRLEAFDEALYLLSCGSGVGFSCERQYVNELPDLPKALYDTNTTIVVEDSRIGWAVSLRQLLGMLYVGSIPKFDTSKVRPAGSPLKTFGGRASGPAPLEDLFRYAINIFKSAIESNQRKLTSFQCHSLMCKVGDSIVAGGVRRTALISFSNPSDERMKNAKTGQWWVEHPEFALANNSAVWTEKPSAEIFLDEWLSLVKSKSGERGIFNREAAKKAAGKSGRRDTEHDFGGNPCQPGFATVLTPGGIRTFDDISIGSTIWSGKKWTKVINKVCTGNKSVNAYTTSAGSFIGTKDHRIVQRGEKIKVDLADSIDIAVGPPPNSVSRQSQDVMDGIVFGDGTVHKASNNRVLVCIGVNDHSLFTSEVSNFIGDTYASPTAYRVKTTITSRELPYTYERAIPARFFHGDVDKKCAFLRGLYTSNGSICGGRVTLKASSTDVVEEVQQMLSSLGIKSYIVTNKETSVVFKNGEYPIKESYDLNIGTYEGRMLFNNLVGFIQPYKQSILDNICGRPQVKARTKETFDIKNVEFLGDFPVYDITVDAEEHTYWAGGLLVSNCSEVILRDRGLCNLSEVVARPRDTVDDLLRKVRLAAILGTIQSTITDFRYLSAKWKENAEEERLLGVSLTGIFDNKLLYRQDDSSLPDRLVLLREKVVATNLEWAERLGIPQSTATTCVKPSGTVSALVDSRSGIHPGHARFYVRRNRANKIDPMAQLMYSQGLPCDDDITKPGVGWVFSFPMECPETTVLRKDISAVDHLRLWLIYQTYYCEHKPSVTISVKDHEWLDVGAFVYANFEYMTGVSFLPYSDHSYRQAPYEEVTEEEYNSLLSKMPTNVDWSKIAEFEKFDTTTSAREYACTGSDGMCGL